MGKKTDLKDVTAADNKDVTAADNKDAYIEGLPVPLCDPLDELVEVLLARDNDKYKEPLFVSVNGDSILIRRGVKVQIKRKFFNVIEQSQMQDTLVAEIMERREQEFEDESKSF